MAVTINGTTESLELVTSTAQTVDWTASWVDRAGTTLTPGDAHGTVAAATDTTIVAAAGAATARGVKSITVVNKGASANIVTIQKDVSGTEYFVFEPVSLEAGEMLQYEDGSGLRVFDAAGGVKSGNPLLGLTGVIRADAGLASVDADVTDIVAAATDAAAGKIELAIQSEMEAGTDVGRAVTPGRQHFHPSACKGWGKAAGAGTLTVGYNMDACTDTGVGRLGVNITTDISSTNYTIVTGTAAVATTLTVATIDNGAIVYNASQAAGAFDLWNFDHTATTHVVQDPLDYFWAIFGDFA